MLNGVSDLVVIVFCQHEGINMMEASDLGLFELCPDKKIESQLN